MLTRAYYNLQTKINSIKYIVEDRHIAKLGAFRVLELFILEIIFLFTKYLLILFKHPSESFKILVNQPALAVCPYSYTDHKSFQRKLRAFSLAGFTTLIIATTISSLLVNLTTGPILNTRAATFNWQQANWDASATASSSTSHNPSSGPPSGWTQYSAKDSNLSVVNGGADLQVSSQNNTWIVTDDGTTDTGFNNAGASSSQTAVSGSGSGAGIILANLPANTIDNGNGTWTTTIQPNATTGKDSYVCVLDDQCANTTNFGTATSINLRSYDTVSYIERTYIQFDISNLPISSLSSATLSLYYNYIGGNATDWGTRPVIVKKVTSSWNESTITGDNQPTFDSTSYASADISYGTTGWYNWTVTSLVNEWVTGTSTNSGMQLGVGNYNKWQTVTAYSSDYTTDTSLRPKLIVTYTPSPSASLQGTFTSHIYNTTGNLTYGTLSRTATTPSGTLLTLKARSGNQSNLSDATAWGSCTAITSGQALSTGGCVTNTHQYIQFQASLSTTDTAVTSTLSDVSIVYDNYPTANQTLTSSAYDTSSSGNIVSKISWSTASLPSGAQVRFQVRSSTNGSSWSNWCGYADTGSTCSGSNYFEASHNNVAIAANNPLLSAGFGTPELNDQWIQYKVFLNATTTQTPTLSDLTLQYVVNAPPEFGSSISSTGVTAAQNSDGTVTIRYEIRDTDTTTGTVTPNYLTPTFAYTLNGTDYTSITSSYLASGDLNNKAVQEGAYTIYTATWSPKNQINGNYSTTAKIRVTANDNEAANYSTSALSSSFTLDTTNPALGSPAISINPNSSTTPANATVTLSATDNSSLQMKVGQASDLSDATWETYATSKTVTLDTNPDTVYAQFKDQYNNTSTIGLSTTSTTSETPQNIMLQDTSNLRVVPNQLRIFAAWKIITIPNPGFKQYNVWRSTDNFAGGNGTQIATITNIDTNYYMDITPALGTNYYYRVSSQDQNNNISFFSGSVKAKANGVQDEGEGGGGQEATLPVITNIQTSGVQTTQATITWTTDELANSTVGYSTDISFSTEKGVASYVTSHSVTLTNLAPNNTYKFQVKSTDPSGNQTMNNNSGVGYTFTTQAGPQITNVDNEVLSNTTARIIWYTNTDSNSYVVYSTNSDLSNSSETGTTSLVRSSSPSYYHAVTLSSLTQGTTYYYYVKSTDSEGNIAINNNGLNYYTFKTTQDSVSPTLSSITVSITTPDTAVITWTTNEPSTSQISYGTTTIYGSSTTEDSDLVLTHIVSITNLTPNTTYNFKVISKDSSGNQSISTNQTFTTLEESKIKVDQTAPILSNVSVGSITSSSATITFMSSESCLGEVSYGITTRYDKKAGEVSNTTTHSITIGNLSSSTAYHYQAACIDSSENKGSSPDAIFTTLAPTAAGEGGKSEVEKRVENLIQENFSPEDIRNAVKKLQAPPSIIGEGPTISEIRSTSAKVSWNTDKKASGVIVYSNDFQKISEYRGKILKQELGVTTHGLTTNGNAQESSLAHEISISNLIPGTTYYFIAQSNDIYGNLTVSEVKSFTTLMVPLISSVEISNITLSSAIVNWKTSVITTGYVEYGKDTNYGTKKEHTDSATKGTTHTIALTDLDHTTTYHFRIKGVTSTDSSLISSEGYTFNTQSLPEISNEAIKKITDNSAKITFATNIETDAQIFYRPLAQSGLVTYEQKGKSELGKNHEIILSDLVFGTEYDIKIKVKDMYGNEAEKQLPTFTTGIDLTPPTITLLRTENALVSGKKDKVQTIISWKTDEPSTTRIMYQEGIDITRKELKEKSTEDKTLSKDHVVVITNLKPGTVYQLKAVSKDAQGNETTSKNQTMLTPRQQDSVFQVIIKNLEDVFGWVKKIK